MLDQLPADIQGHINYLREFAQKPETITALAAVLGYIASYWVGKLVFEPFKGPAKLAWWVTKGAGKVGWIFTATTADAAWFLTSKPVVGAWRLAFPPMSMRGQHVLDHLGSTVREASRHIVSTCYHSIYLLPTRDGFAVTVRDRDTGDIIPLKPRELRRIEKAAVAARDKFIADIEYREAREQHELHALDMATSPNRRNLAGQPIVQSTHDIPDVATRSAGILRQMRGGGKKTELRGGLDCAQVAGAI
jgi:hypothetical protein